MNKQRQSIEPVKFTLKLREMSVTFEPIKNYFDNDLSNCVRISGDIPSSIRTPEQARHLYRRLLKKGFRKA